MVSVPTPPPASAPSRHPGGSFPGAAGLGSRLEARLQQAVQAFLRRHPLVNFRSMQMLGHGVRTPRLRLMVHKPTFACTARCKGCAGRRELHRISRRNERMTFEQSVALYEQARALGVSELHISGGEPTLYKRLPELIEAAKRQGFFVLLNTNGSELARPGLARRLFRAGLDGTMLSLYSHRASVHDEMRQRQGLWERALAGLEKVGALRRELNPRFMVITQSILSRDNLFDAPGLLELAGNQGSDVHLFSYLEGDYEARYTPSVDMLRRFRAETVPRLRRVVTGLPEAHPVMKGVAWWRLGTLYDPRRNDLENYARCVYNPTEADWRRCGIPEEFMLVLPDGAVHPCNVVEYVHEPVVGNFRETGDLPAIWDGEPWRRFRRERHSHCRQCPMTYHNWIPLNLTFGRLARLLRGRL